MGVQRAWSGFMNVLASPKGSVGRWNLNFWRLEQFYTNFWKFHLVTPPNYQKLSSFIPKTAHVKLWTTSGSLSTLCDDIIGVRIRSLS
jgi:hypothetical protein